MKPTKEAYLRAADYMDRVGNNKTDSSWGRPFGPCCMGGALMFGNGLKSSIEDSESSMGLLDTLAQWGIKRGINYHKFSKENTTEACTALLREIAQTLPSERQSHTDISALEKIARDVSAGVVRNLADAIGND